MGTKNLFQKDNKAAEKWTEGAVRNILSQMWEIVEDGKEDYQGNYVRANDIKTLTELCLMCGVSIHWWGDIKNKFKNSNSVFRFMARIESVLEARLIYSGGQMDKFVLINKYGYSEKQEIDHTTKGEKITDKADLSKMNPEELTILLKAKQIISGK